MNTKFLETTEYTDYTEKTINASQTSDMVLIVFISVLHDGLLMIKMSSVYSAVVMPLRGAMAASQS